MSEKAKQKDNTLNQQKSLIKNLRTQVKKLINRSLGKHRLAKKEKAIFEHLVSRRDFLKGATKLSLLAGLVSQGLLPSAWGEEHDAFAVSEPHLQLTEAEKAQVNLATGLTYDAELLRDVVYAKPLDIAAEELRHASLEGFCYGMPRLQALQGDTTEQTFLDYDYHYGPVEYVQLVSHDSGKTYALEHFYHTVANANNKSLTTVPQAFTQETIATSRDFVYGLNQPVGLYSGNHFETNKIESHQVYGQWFLYVQAPLVQHNYLLVRQMGAAVGPVVADNQVTNSGWKVLPLAKLLPPDFQASAVLSVNVYYDAKTNPYVCVMLDNINENRFTYVLLYLSTSRALSVEIRFITASEYANQPLWLIDVCPSPQVANTLNYAFSDHQGKRVLTFIEPATATPVVIEGVTVQMKTCKSPRMCPNLFPLFSGKLTALYEVASGITFTTPIPDYQGCTAKAKLALIEGIVYGLMTCDTAPPGKEALVGTFLAFYPLRFPGNTNSNITAFYRSRNKYGSYAFYALRDDGFCFIIRESLAHSTLENPYAPPLRANKTVTSTGVMGDFVFDNYPVFGSTNDPRVMRPLLLAMNF